MGIFSRRDTAPSTLDRVDTLETLRVQVERITSQRRGAGAQYIMLEVAPLVEGCSLLGVPPEYAMQIALSEYSAGYSADYGGSARTEAPLYDMRERRTFENPAQAIATAHELGMPAGWPQHVLEKWPDSYTCSVSLWIEGVRPDNVKSIVEGRGLTHAHPKLAAACLMYPRGISRLVALDGASNEVSKYVSSYYVTPRRFYSYREDMVPWEVLNWASLFNETVVTPEMVELAIDMKMRGTVFWDICQKPRPLDDLRASRDAMRDAGLSDYDDLALMEKLGYSPQFMKRHEHLPPRKVQGIYEVLRETYDQHQTEDLTDKVVAATALYMTAHPKRSTVDSKDVADLAMSPIATLEEYVAWLEAAGDSWSTLHSDMMVLAREGLDPERCADTFANIAPAYRHRRSVSDYLILGFDDPHLREPYEAQVGFSLEYQTHLGSFVRKGGTPEQLSIVVRSGIPEERWVMCATEEPKEVWRQGKPFRDDLSGQGLVIGGVTFIEPRGIQYARTFEGLMSLPQQP